MRKTPVTLGVLSMVFGGLVAVFTGFSLAFSSLGSSFLGSLGSLAANAPRKPGEPDPTVLFSRMSELMKELAPYTNALLGGKLILSLALIAIGWGLYKRQRWGRSGAIAWGGLALLFLAGELIIQLGVIQPRTDAVMREIYAGMPNGAAMMQAMGGMRSTMTVIFSLIFYAPYPIILLALCGRRSAAADFVD
jgi:hypothetical protein